MDILNFTNWKLMVNDVMKRNAYSKLYHETPVAERSKLIKEETLEPRCDTHELNELDLAIATMSKPTKAPGSERFSPSLTLATITDARLKDYLTYVALETSRSKLMSRSAKEDPRHTVLVPIFLAAHKQYNGIAYEDWDKEDQHIKFCVGNKLYTSITEAPNLSDELRRVVRINALMTKTGKPVSPTAYPRGNVKIDGRTKLGASNPFRHIWLQTWVANVELRNEFMILDTVNWDLMPEALDAVHKPEVTADLTPKASYEEELPW